MTPDKVPPFFPPRPVTVLIVEPNLADSLAAINALSTAGFRLTVADFREAKARIAFDPPTLLVADVRQGEYNGLHLVLRGKSARPGMAAVVTSRFEDVVLMREAEVMGATFVLKPVAREEFLAACWRTLSRDRPDEPVRPPFERRAGERRQPIPAGVVPHERRQADRRRPTVAPS